jgi:serine/threonine-protein kinase
MDPERWPEVERILRSILVLDPADRRVALAQACGNDEDLSREVESLLSHEPDSAGFLEGIAGDVRAPEPEPAPGWRAGPYRIIRLLGSGGMGSVWLAERDDDEYRKQVAVKIIKSGLDTKDILQRFRQERQVQANLEHPNIARLLDGGATDDGRPYLVMEYVDGRPILEHCKERGLSIPDRLALFRKVCSAVQYAHQNLVVHRDLKPGNILVGSDGEPKLLDFGIAKVRSPDAGAREAELTSTNLRPMTVKYASPEQVRGEPVTTATDVYSLGVILCELLAGRGPYEVAGDSLSEYERAVCERAPLPPSEAAARSDAPRTGVLLRGDLDAIVLKALRKEPWLRYPSAEALSDDIERHLRGFPVLARRGTTAYRAARFVRRNAAAAVAVTGVFLSLVGGIIATLRQAGIAERERNAAIAATARAEDAAEVARREARRAQRIAHFLQDVLEGASPRKGGRGVTAEQALDRAAARVAEQFGDDPRVEAAIHSVVGETYMALGRYRDAEEHLDESVRILDAARSVESGDLASCLIGLGGAAYLNGDLEKAKTVTERALAVSERVLGPGHADVARSLNNLGAIARAQGHPDLAEALLRRALDLRRRLFGEEHVTVAETLNNLHAVLRARGDLQGAENLAREALAMRRGILGAEHPDTVQSIDNLSVLLAQQGKWQDAEPLTREAVAGFESVVGPDHPDLAIALKNRARVLIELGDHAAAETCLERALAIRRASLPPADERTLGTARLLAGCRVALRKLDEAQAVLEQARADAEAALGPDHAATRGFVEDLLRLAEMREQPGASRPAGRERPASR